MKIAVITDDFQTISAHFGRAQYYQVFTIQDRAVVHREARPKASHSHFGGEHRQGEHGEHHGTDPASEHRHDAMMENITDCEVLIARGMGMGAHNRLVSSGIHPLITELHNIEDAVNAYLAGTTADHPERLH